MFKFGVHISNGTHKLLYAILSSIGQKSEFVPKRQHAETRKYAVTDE